MRLATTSGRPIKIAESGSNTYGDYIKFEDGTMICYRNYQCSLSMIDSWGNGLYYGYCKDNISFSQKFVEKPTVSVAVDLNGSSSFAIVSGIVNIQPSYISQVALARGTSLANWSGILNILAIGRWR